MSIASDITQAKELVLEGMRVRGIRDRNGHDSEVQGRSLVVPLPTFPGRRLVVLGRHRKPFSGREASLCAARGAQDVNKEDTDGMLKMVHKTEPRGSRVAAYAHRN